MEIPKMPNADPLSISTINYLIKKSDHEFTVNKDIKKAVLLRYQAANLSQRYGNQKWRDSILHGTAFMLESAGLEKLSIKNKFACTDWFGAVELFKEALDILPPIGNPNKIFRVDKILEESFNRVYKPLKIADESGDNGSVIDYLCELSSLLYKSAIACPNSEKLKEMDIEFENILEDYPYSRIELRNRARIKDDHKNRINVENSIFFELDALRRRSDSKESEFQSVFRHNLKGAIRYGEDLERQGDHENASYLYSALSKLFAKFGQKDSAELATMKSITNSKEQRRKAECDNKLTEALFWSERGTGSYAHIYDMHGAFLMKVHADILREEIYKTYELY